MSDFPHFSALVITPSSWLVLGAFPDGSVCPGSFLHPHGIPRTQTFHIMSAYIGTSVAGSAEESCQALGKREEI